MEGSQENNSRNDRRRKPQNRSKPEKKEISKEMLEKLSPPQILERVASQWNHQLSPAQVEKIQSQHPSLATYDLLREVTEHLEEDMQREAKMGATKSLMPVIRAFANETKEWMDEDRKTRRSMLPDVKEAKSKSDPEELNLKHSARMYQNGILQAQDVFNRKKNFKSYAESNLMEEKEMVEEAIEKGSGVITEEVAERYLMVYNEEVRKRNAEVEAECRREMKKELESILVGMVETNRMVVNAKKFEREERLRYKIALRQARNEQIGGNLGYCFSMRDYVKEISKK